MSIQFISAAAARPLRQKVLRPRWTLEECEYPCDADPETFHLGFFLNGELVAIATFQRETHPDFPSGSSFRLRGMASDEKVRGRGFAARIVRRGVEVLRARGADFLWFNARVGAMGFYEKLGFVAYGGLFDIDDIGPHKVMYKFLNPG